jgi:hypothetical protein
MNNWTSFNENILENIRLNSVMLSEYHKTRYLYLKGYIKYFRIPLIILSSVNAVASVGLSPYVKSQNSISGLTCLISLICGIITSIELYLGLEQDLANELLNSKQFYLLSIDIFKTLSLSREERSIDGKTFLDNKYQCYCELIKNSNLLKKKIKDKLTPIQHEKLTSDSCSSNNSSNDNFI